MSPTDVIMFPSEMILRDSSAYLAAIHLKFKIGIAIRAENRTTNANVYALTTPLQLLIMVRWLCGRPIFFLIFVSTQYSHSFGSVLISQYAGTTEFVSLL